MGDNSGSKATPQARSGLGPTGYDPGRMVYVFPPKLIADLERIAAGQTDGGMTPEAAAELLKQSVPSLPMKEGRDNG